MNPRDQIVELFKAVRSQRLTRKTWPRFFGGEEEARKVTGSLWRDTDQLPDDIIQQVQRLGGEDVITFASLARFLNKTLRTKGWPSGLILRGNRYHIDHTVKGRHLRRSLNTSDYENALAAYNAIVGDAERGIYNLVESQKPVMFDTLVKDYLKDAKARKRAFSYQRDITASKHLVNHFTGWGLDKFSPFGVSQYIGARKKQLREAPKNKNLEDSLISFESINVELRLLRGMLKWAENESMIRYDNFPVNGKDHFIKTDKKPKPIDPEDFEKLLAECLPHLRRLVAFAERIGCRLNEVQHLRWENVSSDWQTLELDSHHAKDKRHNTFYLDARAEEILKGVGRKDHGPIFLNSNGEPYNREGIKTSLMRASKRAGLYPTSVEQRNKWRVIGKEPVTFHALRHTFCTRIYNDPRIPFKRQMMLCRHKSAEMADRYMKIDRADLVRDIRNGN